MAKIMNISGKSCMAIHLIRHGIFQAGLTQFKSVNLSIFHLFEIYFNFRFWRQVENAPDYFFRVRLKSSDGFDWEELFSR